MLDNDAPIFTEYEWSRLREALGLSRRQMDIVKCFFLGFGLRKISHHMDLSLPTVRGYVNRVFAKLDAADRPQVILRIVSEFLEGCRPDGCHRIQRHHLQ